MKELSIEEKAKRYDESLEQLKGLIESIREDKYAIVEEDIIGIFPELKEPEDEKVKRIIHSISNKISFHLHDIFTEEEFQYFDAWSNAWLKKQNKHQQLYIRFGNIPSNEKSKIYRGEEEIGYENGVSVYPAFEDVNGNIVLGLSLPITKTTLYTQQHLIEYDDRLCYLVKGDYVGKGTDGEPLIKNVRIIKEIKPYRMKQDKENNIYIINNTPNCNISVYNEELKESEDERIRKALIKVFSNREKYLIDQSFGDITVSEALAWLEKQGESDEIKAKEFLINKGYPIDANGTFPTYEEMYNIIREGLEKQDIYKIWTNNDYDKVKSIEYLLHEFDNHNFDDWFNSLKKEWSNEKEKD